MVGVKLKKNVIFRLCFDKKQIPIPKPFFVFLFHTERFQTDTSPYRKYADIYPIELSSEICEELVKMKEQDRFHWVAFFNTI